MAKLKNRQHERFCVEYVSNGFNGAAAARGAGYSERSARQQASELLTKPNIMQRVEELSDDINDDRIMTAQELLVEMSKMARFNMKEAFDENGNLLPVHEMTDEAAMMVRKVERLAGNITRVEFSSDKRPAMEMLAKYHEIYAGHEQAGAMQIIMDDKDAQA